MNFLGFRPNVFIISKKNRSSFFELFKNEAALRLWYMKNELNTCFQQKFATGSYGVGIGRAWCSRKACEICSSLV
jgi:hypothetical protein